jgi:hypothetical protein
LKINVEPTNLMPVPGYNEVVGTDEMVDSITDAVVGIGKGGYGRISH